MTTHEQKTEGHEELLKKANRLWGRLHSGSDYAACQVIDELLARLEAKHGDQSDEYTR